MESVPVSSELALPLVAVLGLVGWFIVRSGEVRWWVAVLFVLFGFYLSVTVPGRVVHDAVRWFVGLFTGGS